MFRIPALVQTGYFRKPCLVQAASLCEPFQPCVPIIDTHVSMGYARNLWMHAELWQRE